MTFKSDLLRLNVLIIVAWSVFVVGQAATNAADDVRDFQSPLRLEKSFSLPLEVTGGEFTSDSSKIFVFSASANSEDKDQILILDTTDGSLIKRINLKYSVLNWHYVQNENILLVIGNMAGEGNSPGLGVVSLVDIDKGDFKTLLVGPEFNSPSISTSGGAELFFYFADVGDRILRRVPITKFTEAATLPLELVDATEVKIPFKSELSGIRNFRFIDNNTLLVSDVNDAILQVFGLGEYPGFLSDFGYSLGNGTRGIPLEFLPLNPTDTGQSDAFPILVADHQLQSIMLLNFDRIFESLNIQSIARIRFEREDFSDQYSGIPKKFADKLSGPRMLISSSTRGDSLLIGHNESKQLFNYTIRSDLSSVKKSFEQLTNIVLDAFPIDIATSPDGRSVLVSYGLGNSAEVFRFKSETKVTELSGNATIRELQQLLTETGINAGTIDGKLGPVTLNAIKVANNTLGLELDSLQMEDAILKLKEHNELLPKKRETTVFIQFAGFDRDSVRSFATSLDDYGWTVPSARFGGERTPKAAGTLEIRTNSKTNTELPEALKRDVLKTGLIQDITIKNNNNIDTNVLEVWISPVR